MRPRQEYEKLIIKPIENLKGGGGGRILDNVEGDVYCHNPSNKQVAETLEWLPA